MFSRSLAALTFSLLASATTLAGCAAETETDADVGQEGQDLSPAASNLVGAWTAAVTTLEVRDVPAGTIHDLTLRDDGSFGAHVYGDAGAAPSESNGTWKTRRYQGAVRLYLTQGDVTVRYEAVQDDGLLTLRDPNGNASVLQRDPCSDVVCAATLTCVEGECVPFEPEADPCADVVCAATLTCVEGECVPFEDQVDPCADVVCAATLTCVEGECVPFEEEPATCGDVVCAAGTECCNPLAGICVAPGEVCAF